MRLLQAGKAYHPHIGGIETVMREVAEGAAAAGWDSRVLSVAESRRGSRDELNGVDVLRTGSLGRVLSLPIAPGYGRALRSQQADALIVHEPTLLAGLAAIGRRQELRRRFGRILVWWHSDIVRQRLASPIYGPIQAKVLDLADTIVVATPNHVSSSDTLGAYQRKIAVVPYGIDVHRYQWSDARARRVAKVKAALPDRPLVVFAGRLARYKGIAELMAAMGLVSDAHLVVAGAGACESVVQESTATRQGRVTVLPHLDDEAFVDLLWAADVFVLPSTQRSEAFGIVQLEAMACRTPVVTFDLPTGVTWVNRDGETGLVAPLGDVPAMAACISRLTRERSLRERLGSAAQERVEREFSVERMVASTLELCAGGASTSNAALAPAIGR